jgi:hypothetical protein
MKILFYFWCLGCAPAILAQTDPTPAKNQPSVSQVASFEAYCLQHALSVITAPASKASTELAGTIEFKGDKATYKDYNLLLLEDKAQYFRIAGTGQLLVVQSLYRLKLNYNSPNIRTL